MKRLESNNMKWNFRAGFTLVEVMIVVAVIGLLAALAVPNYIRARETSQMNACISNLHLIDGAVQQWALEYKKSTSSTVAYSDISDYMRSSHLCPAGGTSFDDSYVLVDVQTPAVCQKSTTHILP